jgi:hypothetical protein
MSITFSNLARAIMAPSGSSVGLRLYATKPYESDGGFSLIGLFLTIAIGVTVALVMGLTAGIVGQFVYAVLVFPLGIGLAVGGALFWAIQHTKIRTPWVCGAAGLVAGVVAVTTMHYFNYLYFHQEMGQAAFEEQALRQDIANTRDPLEREVLREVLAEYEADSEVLSAKQVSSFTSYIDWSARQGVSISRTRSQSKGLNLGYTGTYAYWGGEAVIVAVIAATLARRRASAPFCVKCDMWKAVRELGSLHAGRKAVDELVQSGRLADLPAIVGTAGEEVATSVWECPSCPCEDEVVLQVDQVTYYNGARVKYPTSRAIYPRAVVEDLARYFGGAAAEGETGELVASMS